MMKKTAIFVAAVLAASAQYRPLRELTSEEKRTVDAALPAAAPAQPKKPRRILLTNLCKRDGKVIGTHPSSPFGNYALEQMGRKTGAFTVTQGADERSFSRANLETFDAIVFLNTNGVLTEDSELRQSLLDFVRSGKGFVGFHAAGATFVQYPRYDQFPEFGVMLGGYEDGGHPWGPKDTTHVKIDDPAHPVNAPFNGRPFAIHDEAFQFREPNIRDRLRVLLSIDTSRMDLTRRILPQRRKDLDFPVSWVKTYGEGRVFYTTMGHSPTAFQSRPLLEHFLAGIQFALGDLEADAAPSAKAQVSKR